MNIKRILTWVGFVVVIGLIIWGLVAAQKKSEKMNSGELLTLSKEVTAEDWITGNKDATTTLVEYADFQCPACGAYYPIVKQLMADYGDKIRLVYRHFPLSQHINAFPAAIAAEAAGRQGNDKFWAMEDLLFTNQKDWEELKEPSSVFSEYAKTIGLDIEKFAKDVKDDSLRQKIADSYKEGFKAGINQTPTFFLNGKQITNPASLEAFKTTIDGAIK